MKKQLSLILTSLALAFSVGAISYSKKAESKIGEVDAAQHAENYADYTYSGNYYSSITSDKTEGMDGTIRSTLTGLINPVKTPTYGSDGEEHLSTILQYADEDPLNSNNMIYLYTRDSVTKNAASSWNREHVWPQSLSNSHWGKTRAGSDLLHLRPTYNTTNSTRGNLKYGQFSGGTTCTYGTPSMTYGYTYNNTYFMPLDSVKGDVARICMYIWVAYYNEYSSNRPALTNVFQSFDVLMSWHTQDKPDIMEGNRNDYSETSMQKNRNPFVDHPEYAWKIFGSQCSASVLAAAKSAYPDNPLVGITSISKTSASLIRNNSTTISATSSNSGTISWSSDNTSVATVSSATSASGKEITINAVGAGSAVITASITISGVTYSKECAVTVAASKQVSSISVSGQKTKFTVGDSFSFGGTVTATYNDGTQSDVTSSATITPPDMTTAGTKTVSVSYTYGVSASTTYEIKINASGGGSTDYELYSGSITDGNYLIVYNNKAMNTTVSSNRLQFETVTPVNGVISNPSASIIWHIESIDNYWTIYNENDAKYAAGTGTKSQASTSSTDTDDKTKWSISGSSTYEIVNKYNSEHSVNANLRENTTYGYACYSTSTGGSLSLYKQASGSSKTLESISVSTNPTNLDYEVGDYFDPTGLVIELFYSDESTEEYEYEDHESEFTFDPSLLTPLTLEDEYVEITYSSLSCDLEIDVQEPKELLSISISSYTTSFVEGDTFSFGGTVTANYSDDSHVDVTTSATFNGYTMTALGNQTVTVSYGGKSQTYQITVSAGTVSSISLSGQTTTYTKNASFSFDGTCTATFANGYQKVVTPTSVTSPDMSTTGNKTITVSYSYNGNTRQTTYQITVNSYRTVMEASEVSGTITWASSTATITGSVTGLAAQTSGRTQYENQSMRLGTGSGGGTLTISASISITKLTISAKYYSSSYSSSVLKVDGQSLNSLTSSYKNYTVTLTSAKTSLSVLTENSSSRVNIQSVTVYANGPETDIGQSEDCIGLETFITNYMHMDYTENLGYCSDSEHHYYSTAKEAFNALNSHQRSLFTGNSAYSVEWTRLSTWASKNGDSLNGSNQLASGVNQNPVSIFVGSSGNVVAIITVIALISAASIGGYFFIKKRKEI